MSIEKSPYVGVSGVVNIDQEHELLDVWQEDATVSHKRNILLGVKAVHKTQWLDIENKYGPGWYPVGDVRFANAVLGGHDGVINAAQIYLDPEAIGTDATYAERFVDRIQERGHLWLDALQFDMLPYDIGETAPWQKLIEDIHSNNKAVLIQCHKRAMSVGPRRAIERIKSLGLLDYVLFDASHGTGKEMDVDDLLRFLDQANNDATLSGNGTLYGVAGGLDAESVQAVLPQIVEKFPDTSWDAEGRLHHQASDRSIDMSFARQYLRASQDIIT